MKRLSSYILLVLTGLIFIGVTSASAQKIMKQKPIMWAAEDIKWEDVKGGPPGIMAAKLWGDMTRGAYGDLVKFSPNQQHPLHIHTSDIRVVVITGSFVTGPEGGPEKAYGPGSYLLVPGGWRHTSGAGADGCTIFQEQSAKFDMKQVKPKGKK